MCSIVGVGSTVRGVTSPPDHDAADRAARGGARTIAGPVVDAARAAMAAARAAEHAVVDQVAALDAAGVVTGSGYRQLARLLEDLWRLNPAAARRLVTRAALLGPRTTLSGETLAPRLRAATSATFSISARPLGLGARLKPT